MYLSHFGLREAPFSLTPDPEFFYGYSGHQEALNVLLVALRGGEGFIKIAGEVGTGKTLLCRKLLSALDEGFRAAYLPNPLLTPFELHKALAQEFGIKTPAEATLHDLVKQVTKTLVELNRRGQKAVLCIDEAQAMPTESLEALRLLSNLETEKQKLLQIVVFAQPEFNTLLQGDALRQLRQRITFSYELPPLDGAGVAGYIRHRLRVAGYGGGDLFAPAAVAAVAAASRGIPRLVNVLCHKALLAGYGQGVPVVDVAQVAAAIRDTEDAAPSRRGFWDEPLHRWLGAATAVEAVLLLWLLWSALA
ncbi:MAG: AAA family ATPase [Deltaproteobacteria bacterium]|nr:MAG: AAA family ATPase [Deltaproteobacteria bacterium]